jgi:hypothetical protein
VACMQPPLHPLIPTGFWEPDGSLADHDPGLERQHETHGTENYGTAELLTRLTQSTQCSNCASKRARYQMAVTPCTAQNLEAVDAVIGRLVRCSNGLPKSAASFLLMELVEAFIMGCSSVHAHARR